MLLQPDIPAQMAGHMGRDGPDFPAADERCDQRAGDDPCAMTVDHQTEGDMRGQFAHDSRVLLHVCSR